MATPRTTCPAGLFACAALAIGLVAHPPASFGQDFERLPPVTEVIGVGWLEEEGSPELTYFLDIAPGPLDNPGHLAALPLAPEFQEWQTAATWDAGTLPPGERLESPVHRDLWNDIRLDHVHFYSWTTVRRTLPVLGGAAVLAHTSADLEIRNWWQANLHESGLNGFWDGAKLLGEGSWMIPLAAGAWVAGEYLSPADSSHWLGQWGGRTTRGYLVGFPVLLASQWAVGASRPYDASGSSHWTPFQDTNGVSGHAFMGAMPFFAAASLCETPWARALCYAGSLATPLSRIEHDAHFASQALLGWWLAYLASSAIDTTLDSFGGWSLEPMPVRDGIGMMFAWQR
jgi:hypothetical protein